jgi:glycosyltransferase involved in cell wall biosynthesis
MRLLIDFTQVPLARTGAGVYAENLLKELVNLLPPEDELFVLLQNDDPVLNEVISRRANVHPLFISSRVFRNRLALALYEQCVLPWLVLYYRVELMHSLHYTFPLLCARPRVVTIHDMTHSLWPNMHTVGRRLAMSFFAKIAMRHAEGVLFVSQSTRNDAEKLFGMGNNLRRVTPLGVDDACFSVISQPQIRDTLSRLKIESPYILFLGTLEPRKNVLRLIQAFDSIGDKYPQHTLVIAGVLGWNYQPALNAIERSIRKQRIIRLGYVTPEDKASLLAGCDLLVYPSLYEGFGLPVLEGMAAGVPIVTSNVSSLPEVAGDAAIMVNPISTEEISNAMCRVLEEKLYSEKLRQAGKIQARKFSWKRTARLTYAAYLEVIRDSQN